MELVFFETFEGNKLNRDKWRVICGGHGWGNNESQFYVDNEDNIKVEDGRLRIIALKKRHEHREYTSGKIETLKAFQYGHFEFVCKVPKGKGSWPAIWMMPENKEGGWPYCGEIDIVETIGRHQDVMHFSLHTKKYNHNIGNQRTFYMPVAGASDRYVTYTMDWTKDYISFGVDNKEVCRFDKNDKRYDEGVESWPFDKKFYIICNLAVGGYWGGEIDDEALPMEFDIKSIKVLQNGEENNL